MRKRVISLRFNFFNAALLWADVMRHNRLGNESLCSAGYAYRRGAVSGTVKAKCTVDILLFRERFVSWTFVCFRLRHCVFLSMLFCMN